MVLLVRTGDNRERPEPGERRIGPDTRPQHQHVGVVQSPAAGTEVEDLGVGQSVRHHDVVEVSLHVLEDDRSRAPGNYQAVGMEDLPRHRHWCTNPEAYFSLSPITRTSPSGIGL